MTAEEQNALRALVAEHGEWKTPELFGVSDRTLVRAVAGFGLQPATRFLIRQKLIELASDLEESA